MIKTYGLFWRTDSIFWGKSNNAGALLGAKSQSKGSVPVDFRDQRGIYALYSRYELVYVWQAGAGDQRLLNRLKFHLTDHLVGRWDKFSWFGTQWVTQQHKLSTDTSSVNVDFGKAMNILEAVCIAIAEPRLNLQRGRWGDAKQYYQVADDRRSES